MSDEEVIFKLTKGDVRELAKSHLDREPTEEEMEQIIYMLRNILRDAASYSSFVKALDDGKEVLVENETLLTVSYADAQKKALDKIGRLLTVDELEEVKDGFNWGMEDWDNVLSSAMDNVVNDEDMEM